MLGPSFSRASPECPDQSAARTTATVAGILAAPHRRDLFTVVRPVDVFMRDNDVIARRFGAVQYGGSGTATPRGSDAVFGSFIQSTQAQKEQ